MYRCCKYYGYIWIKEKAKKNTISIAAEKAFDKIKLSTIWAKREHSSI